MFALHGTLSPSAAPGVLVPLAKRRKSSYEQEGRRFQLKRARLTKPHSDIRDTTVSSL